MQPHPEFSLRLATPEDSEFLYQLYAASRDSELQMAGLSAEQREAFCRMQFGFRQHHYGLHFGHAQDRILLWQGVAVGRELVTRDPDLIGLTDIAILPSYQGRGMGSFLLRGLIAESIERKVPIELHVDQGSRAQALYERHGFVIIEDQFPNWYMRRAPVLADLV
jgi:ribosomal protein S18 acetylase RimI-like enzyme